MPLFSPSIVCFLQSFFSVTVAKHDPRPLYISLTQIRKPCFIPYLGLPRVLEYSSTYSSNKTTRISTYYSNARCFLFPVANFHFRLPFFCRQLMSCWNSWKIGSSRFHFQLASLEVGLNICMLGQGPYTLRAPGTLTHHPFFVIGSSY